MNSSAPTLLDRTGETISNKYVLDRLIGVGGMGEVWEATNVDLHAHVALKLIRPQLGDAISHGRLLQEARSAAQLSHPAIIRIFDVGETGNGAPYIVMERLEGESLRAHLDGGSQNIVSVVQTLLPILDALALAHQKGMVHRDVKPDNIFLSKVGKHRIQPKLLDFGLAKERSVSRQFTTDGTVVGSPPYMSPEQAAGENEAESAADLWSINVILYEAACGELPFMADNYNKLMRLIVSEEAPPLPRTNPLIASLAPIVSKGLAKDVAQRWQTAEELGEALASWLMDHGVGEDATGAGITGRWNLTTPARLHASGRDSHTGDHGVATRTPPASRPSPSKTKSVVWISAVALLAIASGVTWSLVRPPAEPSEMEPRATTAPLQSVALTATSGANSEASASEAASALDGPPPPATAVPATRSIPSGAKAARAPAAGTLEPRRKPQATPPPPSPKEEGAEDLGLKNPY